MNTVTLSPKYDRATKLAEEAVSGIKSLVHPEACRVIEHPGTVERMIVWLRQRFIDLGLGLEDVVMLKMFHEDVRPEFGLQRVRVGAYKKVNEIFNEPVRLEGEKGDPFIGITAPEILRLVMPTRCFAKIALETKTWPVKSGESACIVALSHGGISIDSEAMMSAEMADGKRNSKIPSPIGEAHGEDGLCVYGPDDVSALLAHRNEEIGSSKPISTTVYPELEGVFVWQEFSDPSKMPKFPPKRGLRL